MTAHRRTLQYTIFDLRHHLFPITVLQAQKTVIALLDLSAVFRLKFSLLTMIVSTHIIWVKRVISSVYIGGLKAAGLYITANRIISGFPDYNINKLYNNFKFQFWIELWTQICYFPSAEIGKGCWNGFFSDDMNTKIFNCEKSLDFWYQYLFHDLKCFFLRIFEPKLRMNQPLSNISKMAKSTQLLVPWSVYILMGLLVVLTFSKDRKKIQTEILQKYIKKVCNSFKAFDHSKQKFQIQFTYIYN